MSHLNIGSRDASSQRNGDKGSAKERPVRGSGMKPPRTVEKKFCSRGRAGRAQSRAPRALLVTVPHTNTGLIKCSWTPLKHRPARLEQETSTIFHLAISDSGGDFLLPGVSMVDVRPPSGALYSKCSVGFLRTTFPITVHLSLQLPGTHKYDFSFAEATFGSYRTRKKLQMFLFF